MTNNEKINYHENYFINSNVRECRFFIKKLNAMFIPLTEALSKTNIIPIPCNNYEVDALENAEKIINDSIYFHFKETEKINLFISEIRSLANKHLVNEKYLNSLFTDQRSIYFAWVYLNIITSDMINSEYKGRVKILRTANYNDFDNISKTKDIMIDTITKITDSMTGSRIDKEILLCEINVKYTNSVFNFINPFPWVEDDISECERIFNSLEKTITEKNKMNKIWNSLALSLCKKIFVHHPIAAIHTLFDILIYNDNHKVIFIKKIAKSWSQSQLRLKQKNSRKNITVSISEASYESLKIIRKITKKSTDEIIDNMILNALPK